MPKQHGKKTGKKIKQVAFQAAAAETSSGPTRRYRAVLFQVMGVIATSAFILLTFLAKTTAYFPIDLQITRAIQLVSFPLFGMFMSLISWFGFFPQSLITVGLIVLVIYTLGIRWEAWVSLGAAIFVQSLNELVKDYVQRPRPSASLVHVIESLSSYSFPSGHVMFYTGFFGFLWFLTFSLLKPSLKRGVLLVFFGSLVLLIGPSRIYLGEHWASDVLGAYLLGSLALIGIIQFYIWGKTRFFVQQPVAGPKSPKRAR